MMNKREGGEREKWFKDTQEKMRVENVSGAKRSLWLKSVFIKCDSRRLVKEW